MKTALRIAMVCSIFLLIPIHLLAGMNTPLPSWNDGPAKQSIIQFVQSVTTEGGAQFVPPAERIAVIDNDGTLWAEQPMYVQLAFAIDRVTALAPQHPEWKVKESSASALKGWTVVDMKRDWKTVLGLESR